MEERIKTGHMQLFRYPKGVIVTEIKQLSDERLMHVVWLNGNAFEGWKSQAFEDLKRFAKSQGCKAIEAHCRPGLAKSLKSLGYRKIKETVRVDL